MQRFANLRDAGSQLADRLAAEYTMSTAVLVPILPNGVPVALGIVDGLRLRTEGQVHADGIHIEPLEVVRGQDGISVPAVPHLGGKPVVVVDDGVETGTAALAAGRALRGELRSRHGSDEYCLDIREGRDEGALLRAVPVCPHQALPELLQVFDAVVAVHRPLARRSLSWHYVDLDLIDNSQALELLGRTPRG